jgi:hypothetical protein
MSCWDELGRGRVGKRGGLRSTWVREANPIGGVQHCSLVSTASCLRGWGGIVVCPSCREYLREILKELMPIENISAAIHSTALVMPAQQGKNSEVFIV